MVGSQVKLLGACDVDISSVERPIVVRAAVVSITVVGASVVGLDVVAASVVGGIVLDIDSLDISQLIPEKPAKQPCMSKAFAQHFKFANAISQGC